MLLGGMTMSKLRLGVVFGGQSSEYSVSLHSTASFLRQIHAENYEMTLIGINKNGHFYLYNGDIDSIEHDTWENETTCVSCAWEMLFNLNVKWYYRPIQWDSEKDEHTSFGSTVMCS